MVLAGGASAQPVIQPSVTIDGPSSAISGPSSLSVARGGTGGLAYVKAVGGVKHVFVSRLVSGRFGAPEEVDGTLSSDSSEPVIAANDNGLLLIAFVNGDVLYVITRPSATAPYTAPQPIIAGAANLAIAISIHGKGYLAFTAPGGGGHDIRTAYYDAGQWALESAPLDAAPADDAGTGTGRPRVTAAGDGVGIVVWGEAGHVYSRRVWATSPSVVFEQADVPSFGGLTETAAELPSIDSSDDSSFADVALEEHFANGSGSISRVLMRRLRGSLYESAVAADGITSAAPDNAVQPELAESEVDHGFITSSRTSTNQIYAAELGDGGLIGTTARVDTLPSASAPYAVPATTGLYSGLIVYQRDPGFAGATEIRTRFFDGTSFGPDTLASSPALGPTNAAAGLFASGDTAGDIAIAWAQGTGSQTAIEGALLYYPPGGFGPSGVPAYAARANPTFAWSAAREQWGPVRYVLSIDGVQVAQTGATSIRAPSPLPDGPHTWQVTAVNQAGVSTSSRASSIFVDTVAPSVQFRLTGLERAGQKLHLAVRYTDEPPPATVGSGVASVVVNWGDGSSSRIGHGASHRYGLPGVYRITVRITDRAGNVVRIGRKIRIRGILLGRRRR